MSVNKLPEDCLVVANWKAHGTVAFAADNLDAFARGVSAESPRVVLCPPFGLLSVVAGWLAGRACPKWSLGAQSVSRYDGGAYTGEVTAGMLRDLSCTHVLVGHSERRQHFGETDEVVAAQVAQCLATGIAPVLCVGETLAEREAGATLRRVLAQLDAAIPPDGILPGAVAYEPIWAIGSGRAATAGQVAEVHAALRAHLAARWDGGGQVPLLYGGSVNPDNAADLFRIDNIDGALVGGASLDGEKFATICRQATRV